MPDHSDFFSTTENVSATEFKQQRERIRAAAMTDEQRNERNKTA